MISEYNKNERFKEYVDKYCAKHHVTVDVALKHEVVKQFYLMVVGK